MRFRFIWMISLYPLRNNTRSRSTLSIGARCGSITNAPVKRTWHWSTRTIYHDPENIVPVWTHYLVDQSSPFRIKLVVFSQLCFYCLHREFLSIPRNPNLCSCNEKFQTAVLLLWPWRWRKRQFRSETPWRDGSTQLRKQPWRVTRIKLHSWDFSPFTLIVWNKNEPFHDYVFTTE